MQREQQLHKAHEQKHVGKVSRLSPKMCKWGMVGFAAMAINGCIHTARPEQVPGRPMNTNPLLGFDISLLVGIIGVCYFWYRLQQSK